MNKSLLVGMAIGAAAAVAAGAFAGYQLGTGRPQASAQSSPQASAQSDQQAAADATPAAAAGSGAQSSRQRPGRPQYAEVVQVIPLTHEVVTPRQQCHDVTVTHVRPAGDNHQIIGSIAGALGGGLVGHQIGGGTGKDIATAAGAVAGGYAGNRIEKHIQDGNTDTATERQCRTVDQKTGQPNGYEVRYRLNGREGTVRMDHDPGQRIPVRNGQLVLSGGGSG